MESELLIGASCWETTDFFRCGALWRVGALSFGGEVSVLCWGFARGSVGLSRECGRREDGEDEFSGSFGVREASMAIFKFCGASGRVERAWMHLPGSE